MQVKIKSIVLLLTLSSCACVFADAVPIEDLSSASGEAKSAPAVVTLSSANTGAAVSGQQVAASSLSLDQRVGRLEQQVQAQNSTVQQVDLLQQQVQELQGRIDEQQHQIQQLNDQLNKFYTDLDQRIAGGAATTAVGAKAITAVPEKNAAVSGQEQQAYDAAYNLLKNGQYDQAVPKFKSYIKTYPEGKYVANCHFWLGEIYYLQSDLKGALDEFQTITKNYKDSQKLPDAMLKIAVIHYDQGLYTTARKEFTSIKKTYPNTNVARMADQQLKKMNMQQV